MQHILRQLGRLIIILLIIFEVLNFFKVLNFSLDFTWLGLVLSSAATLITVEIVSAALKRHTGRPLLDIVYLMVAVSVLLDAVSDIFRLYSSFDYTDKILHFLAGGAAAIFIFSVIKDYVDAKKINLGRFGRIFFPICTASFLGTLYEIEEYAESYFFGTNRLGDAFDTANDLLMNNLGAVFFMLFIFYAFPQALKSSRIKPPDHF